MPSRWAGDESEAGVTHPDELIGVKTKIVATLGPASESPQTIEQLMRAGADVFRLNCAHGDAAWHDAVAQRIRQVSDRLGRPAAILQDLAGPKIRLGELAGGVSTLEIGQRVRIVAAPSQTPGELPVNHPALLDDLNAGDAVLLADGTVALSVVGKRPGTVEAVVTLGGQVRSKQGINAPGAKLSLAPLTAKDLMDLDGAAARGADFVGMSFVRRPEDVVQLRIELEKRRLDAQIVAKIEKTEALDALDDILQQTDAAMVARGDLGVEIDVARVPVVQKHIIRRCNLWGVPVITATQMLESMRSSHRPTRAEAADVANAILDGTDAVMLSAETATGDYPVEAVAVMNRIAFETEQALFGRRRENLGSASEWRRLRAARSEGIAQASGPSPAAAEGPLPETTLAAVEAAGQIADRVQAKLVVAATHAGHTALALSRQRNQTPTLGLSDRPATVRRMTLYWGVWPVLFCEPRRPEEFIAGVARWAVQHRLAAAGDRIVFVFGTHWADSRYNSILVHQVED